MGAAGGVRKRAARAGIVLRRIGARRQSSADRGGRAGAGRLRPALDARADAHQA